MVLPHLQTVCLKGLQRCFIAWYFLSACHRWDVSLFMRHVTMHILDIHERWNWATGCAITKLGDWWGSTPLGTWQVPLNLIPQPTSYLNPLPTSTHFLPQPTSYLNPLHTSTHFIPQPTSYLSPLHTSTHVEDFLYILFPLHLPPLPLPLLSFLCVTIRGWNLRWHTLLCGSPTCGYMSQLRWHTLLCWLPHMWLCHNMKILGSRAWGWVAQASSSCSVHVLWSLRRLMAH